MGIIIEIRSIYKSPLAIEINNQLKHERSDTLKKSNIPIGYFAHKHGFEKRKTQWQ